MLLHINGHVCYVLRTCGLVLVIFFFKQKTAYDMRISDWSSDVCSSDLLIIERQRLCGAGYAACRINRLLIRSDDCKRFIAIARRSCTTRRKCDEEALVRGGPLAPARQRNARRATAARMPIPSPFGCSATPR